MKNSKNIWKGIHDLINMKKDKTDVNKISLNLNGQNTTDLKRVADEFNSYFTSVADEIRKKIPRSKKDFKSYLRNRTRNSLFFSPITKDEVLKTIKLLDLTKSTGPCSLPLKTLETVLDELSDIMKDIFNLSLQTGVFLKSLKNVRVVPVYKSKGSQNEVTIVQSLCYLTLIKYLKSLSIPE